MEFIWIYSEDLKNPHAYITDGKRMNKIMLNKSKTHAVNAKENDWEAAGKYYDTCKTHTHT